ncbi:MAG: YkgJ family cysteine cluster protein [archaeon]
MKSIKSICSACQECCKRYNITLLPKEAEKIAKKLGLSKKEFIEKNCELMLQFFPSGKTENFFAVKKQVVPEKILEKLEKHSDSDYFFVLPNISLKKKEHCVFLENGLCTIHEAKPMQCKLFPFISLKKETDFKKSYSFCALLKQGFKHEKDFQEKSQAHYENIKNYFDKIKKQGFNSIWKILPKKGNAFFEDKRLCELSKEDFNAIFQAKTFK